MGCCISKCKPKKHSIEEFNQVVQDKLVISQAPKTPKIPIPTSNKISPSPPSPTTSSTSVASFTCSNTISSCSSLSSGSSILGSKDHRSFSNEFLWSCVKENPHIIRINSIKEHSQLVVPPNVHVRKLDSAAKKNVTTQNHLIPQRVNGSSTRQKRVRSNSPTTLTRQKSFRKEPAERLDSSYSLPSRNTLRSPSPSRRFKGDAGRLISTITPKESGSKRIAGSKVINGATNSIYSSLAKENLRPVSPYIHPSDNLRPCLMKNKETCIHRISSKIDEIAVQEALAHQDNDSSPMEDVDNPLISLDCFIFL